MPEPAILTENLTRDFDTVRAVDQLSLQVPPGIVFGFLGPNGAGKTTTIRMLLGLLEPSSGKAQVLGFDTRKQAGEIRARCGALLEHNGLYERLSAKDNLEFYGRVWHIPAAERQSRQKELLERLGLWERRAEIVGSWSRGMKQKLAVARALFHRPSLVFMDEPTAGLDPVAASALRDDLALLAEQEGVTVFLTTHNLPEAEKLCHQVGVIRQGKILAVGTPDELRAQVSTPSLEVIGKGLTPQLLEQVQARPEVESARIYNNHLSIALRERVETADLVSFLVLNGVQIEEVNKGKASLEEAFLNLVEE